MDGRDSILSYLINSNNNYFIYNYIFIDEKIVTRSKNQIKFLLIQIPLNIKINDLSIQFKLGNKILDEINLKNNNNDYDNKNFF